MTDTDVVASLAVTLDGYIARTDGSVDYLDKYPMDDFNFGEFTDTIGALIMGRDTFETTVGFGWIWKDIPTKVLTTRTDLVAPAGSNITFAAQPTAEAIRSFSAETPKRLWVFGGAQVITEGLAGGAIETLDLTVIPEALGRGIPLFQRPYSGPLRLTGHTSYANGAIRLIYDTTPD
jgi:dihydrofolate reductase